MARLIVWIIIGLLALSFFGISLRQLVNSPTNQDNVSFLSQLLHQGWHTVTVWLHSILDPLVQVIQASLHTPIK